MHMHISPLSRCSKRQVVATNPAPISMKIMFAGVMMPTRHLLWRRTHPATGRLRASTASGGGGGANDDDDDDDDSHPRRSSTSGGDGGGDAARLYLHVGPSGDFWTGPSIFAAKHLTPGYVRSVELGRSLDVDALLELLDEEEDEEKEGEGEEEEDEGGGDDASWTRTIYDEGALPPDLLARLRALEGEKKE
jgi:hypothetical protein